MGRIKMNRAFLGVAALLLALCGAGYTLKCYSCPLANKACTNEVDCPTTDNSCLTAIVGSHNIYSCLPYNSCNFDDISKKFSINTFQFHCCQKKLCNNSVMTTVNKTIFSLITMLALIWICF